MPLFSKNLSKEMPPLQSWRQKVQIARQPRRERGKWLALKPDWYTLKIAKTVEQQDKINHAHSIWEAHKASFQWSTLDLLLQKTLYHPWLENQAQRGLQEVANYETDLIPKPWLFSGDFNRKLRKQEHECTSVKTSIAADQVRIGTILEERKNLLIEYGHDDPIVVMTRLLQEADVSVASLPTPPETVLTPHFDVKVQLFSANHSHSVQATQLNVVTMGIVQRQDHQAAQPAAMAVTDVDKNVVEEQRSAKHWWWKVWLFVKARARDLSCLTIVVAALLVAAMGSSGILVVVLLIASAVFFYTGVMPFVKGVWRRLKDDPKRLEAEMQTGYQNWYQQVCAFQDDWLRKVSTINGFRASFYLSTYQSLQEEAKMHLCCFEAFKPSIWAFWRRQERAWIQERVKETQARQEIFLAQWQAFPEHLIHLIEEKLKPKADLVLEKDGYSLGIDKQTLLEIQLFLVEVKASPDIWSKYNEVVNLGHSLMALLSQFEKGLKPKEDTSLIELPWKSCQINMSADRWLVFARLLAKNRKEIEAVEGLLSVLMPESRTEENIKQLEKHLKTLFPVESQENIKKQIGHIIWETFQGEFSAKDYCPKEKSEAIFSSYDRHAIEIKNLEESIVALNDRHNVIPYMALLEEWQKKHYPENSLLQSIARATALWRIRGVHGIIGQSWDREYYESQKSNFKEVLYTALMKGQHPEKLEQIITLLVDKEFWSDEEYVTLRHRLIDQRIENVLKSTGTQTVEKFTNFEINMIIETGAKKGAQGSSYWFLNKTAQWLKTNPSNKSVYQWLVCLKDIPIDREDIDRLCKTYMLEKLGNLTDQGQHKKNESELEIMEKLMREVVDLNEAQMPRPQIFQFKSAFTKKMTSFLQESNITAYEILQRVLNVPRNICQ